MEYVIDAGSFKLSLIPEGGDEADAGMHLNIAVESDGFCASANADITPWGWKYFVERLHAAYEDLDGEAVLADSDWEEILSFQGNGRGHFLVKGCLRRPGGPGIEQRLEFAHDIDQSYLGCFCQGLRHTYHP